MRFSPLFASLALLLSAPAFALQGYAGLGITDTSDIGVIDQGDDFEDEFDTDPYRRIFAGVWFADGWAIEAAYHDLGTVSCCKRLADLAIDIDAKAFSIGVLYEYGDAAFAPYTKVGVYQSDVDGHIDTLGGRELVSDSNTGIMGEVGVRWTPSEHFSMRGGYEVFNFEGGTDGGLSIAAQVDF